ncbi:MAG: cbb3-type cytochrome c oxidase subunit I [Chloroflexota bacterium]|nr:cbb3-type cytochrome c oxidase subunit I [Chloroflexia bacterium]MDQ3226388.1 cbb3-type cytochrome c oxidase subunit I [Chloroflexota bacterium]
MASIAQPRIHAPALPRPKAAPSGLWSWLTTVDHKRIAVLYGVTAFIFFLVGGLEALLIRAQLTRPENNIVDAQRYNELFTMHGTTMIFLVVMPLSVALFNLVVPLQLGARDVAFPRLNGFSYWTFLAGAAILNIPVLFALPEVFIRIAGVAWTNFFGSGLLTTVKTFFDFWPFPWFNGWPFAQYVPDQGWYGYAPLTERLFSGREIDFWALGLQVLGVASMAGAFNFIVTIINLRAPGMTMMRMPIFSWATLITSILIVMAFPAITIALVLLTFDRFGGTMFYRAFSLVDGTLVTAGGDPMLWQHLFWIFGHPEVYILILPAFGLVSEIIPVFSRKPLFGYAVMVYAIAAIAFLGFGVWVHHMFTTGIGPTPTAAFAAATMLIAIPTGVKILNWAATMWGGSLSFTTAMLFAVGLVSQFVIGGLSGVMHAVVPVDTQHNDSYFVVAHFHYVLFGGSIFALLGALYFYWPKVFGKLLDERLGKLHFWLTFLGFNLTFFPMHFLGLAGMPRRYSTYSFESGWWFWNVIATIGALFIAASVLVFLINVLRTAQSKQEVGPNPWDAGTLEWAIPSPPPVYNFRIIPLVTHRDQLWHDKYDRHQEAHGRPDGLADAIVELDQHPERAAVGVAELEAQAEEGSIHLPNPSYYPLLCGIGIFLLAFGLLINNPHFQLGFFGIPIVSGIGFVLLVTSIYGWSFEPAG